MTSRLDWIDDELASLEAAHLRRHLRARQSPQSAAVEIDGCTLINFGSNDYLGLAADPRLAEAAQATIATEGTGSGASPLVSGRSTTHARLEVALAEFEGTEAALLFPTGFAANAGTIFALVGRDDVILSDAKNHASLVDGCRLSGATVHIYRHGDCAHAEEFLKQTKDARRRLIVTDTVFSMDGDLAPLPRLAELATKYDAMLLVDEAHATGVFGPQGRGIAEHFGVDDLIDIKIGTLSKACGAAGGFVAGSQRLIDWLANRARPYVFSTAQPAAIAAAAIAALQIVKQEPHRRRELLDRANDLRGRLVDLGCNVGRSASPIVPIYIGQSDHVMQMTAQLAQRGLFVPGIRPPTVPEGEALLRISLSYAHEPAMYDKLVNAVGDLSLPSPTGANS